MFGGTLCSNRHGFYRQAELDNRLRIHTLPQFVPSAPQFSVQWQSLQLCASPLPTYMQGNSQSQERRWQRMDGRRVGGFQRRTYPS